MKKIIKTVLIMLSTTTLFANEQGAMNMGLKVGTLGYGLDVSLPISDSFSARFNLNGFSYTDTVNSDDNDFKGTLDLLTIGMLVDYYPFTSNFRLTSGLYYNASGFTGTISPTGGTSISIGDQSYDINQIDSLDSKITVNSFAPYIGLGWGNDAHDAGWGFTFDLGAMYIGAPQMDLNANIKSTASAALVTEINQELVKEQQKVQDDFNAFKFYPVVMLGVNYTF